MYICNKIIILFLTGLIFILPPLPPVHNELAANWNEHTEEIVAIREIDKLQTEVNTFLGALR